VKYSGDICDVKATSSNGDEELGVQNDLDYDSDQGRESPSSTEEDEVEEDTLPKRRSKLAAASSRHAKAKNSSTSNIRTSSRSTKFTSSMAEPGKSIRDILPAGVTEYAGAKRKSRMNGNASYDEDGIPNRKKAASQSRGKNKKRKIISDKISDSESDEEENVPARNTPKRKKGYGETIVRDSLAGSTRHGSPHKSPARRHAQRRRSLLHREVDSNSSYDDDNSMPDAIESLDVLEDDESSASEPLKIQRILASRTETRQRWKEVCRDINTSEIDYGSRWFQPGDDEQGGDVFEERFLIKWADLSFLHCSWETQQDVMDQIEQPKTYFSTFFRKSINGLLLSADERCDGDYFDPAFNEIDRILEIALPDTHEDAKMTVESEDGYNETSFGMIMDKSRPDFENGTGRQFLIKWCNTPYSGATYEFERDLIMNDVEYKEKVKGFLRRTTKLPKREKERFIKSGQEEFHRLYKVFGRNSDLDEEIREKAVEKYKHDLQKTTYKNGGHLRDYQSEGVAWMISNFVNGRSSILADEMGLGKVCLHV
jgi:hypothetical protein